MSRVQPGRAMGNATEIRKLLGEPIPQLVDPRTLPPALAAMFGESGVLERLRRKLAILSRKKGGQIFPARNVIASVDEEDNLYIGVDFLAQFGADENLLAGILAHEWGHMMSDLPRGVDWSHLTYDELYALRRDEESYADGFAGRALFLLGYTPEPMMHFLEAIGRKKKKEREPLPDHKYHNTATRVEILKQSFAAAQRAMDFARRLFFGGRGGAKVGRVIGAG